MIKKILSYISITLILNNLFLLGNTYASVQLDNQLLQIKVNDGTNYNGDIEVTPGSKLAILVSGLNEGDSITNPYYDFSFSTTNFTYDPTRLKTYVEWIEENVNIPLSTFNPGIINTLPISNSAESGIYLTSYYTDIYINQDTPDNILTISSTLKSDTSSSSKLTRNVFINSNPHITNYYFERGGILTTQMTRGGGDSVDFFIEIKDYNGCDNIDSATVTADLSLLGLTSNESMIYDSCSGNTALYKKASITTLAFPGTLSFNYSNFSVTDESGNISKPNDPQTSFDDEDKKDSISLEIVSAGTPEVTLSISDNNIGGTINQTSEITLSGNQNGEYKLSLESDGICNGGTTLIDWTTGYLAFTDINYSLNQSSLSNGINSIFACVRNDLLETGSSNNSITKDTTNPTIYEFTAGPGNVTTENPNLNFKCSEDGEYEIAKGGAGTLGSGLLIGSGSVLADIANNFTIDNSYLDLDSNEIFAFCLDEAKNYSSNSIIVNKTTPPPSFAGQVINFIDSDIDYDGLDLRDISVTWDNTAGTSYSYFESYRLYILPNNSTLDINNDTYIHLNADSNSNSFIGTTNVSRDSHLNNFVSGSQYKACVAIMGTNGILGTPGCYTGVILTSDTVTHPIINSAKFTTNTNLEITTNATLDTNILNHSGSLISYTYNGSSYSGNSIASVIGQKVNVTINSLSDISAIGTNLLLATGAIRADGGGFNDNTSFANILDGQSPSISNLTNNTSSSYNIFFTGSINLSYTFGEDMKSIDTKFEIYRVGGNADSNTYSSPISGTNLLTGTNNQSINLGALGLVDGTTYGIRIVGQDLAGNYGSSNIINNVSYDTIGPDIVVQDIVNLYSTLTPNLTWAIPLDNIGNGSGIKQYNLDIYNGLNCLGAINSSYNPNTNSQVLGTLSDVEDYSWKLVAIDNMNNIGTSSVCSNFRVDTSVPVYSDYEILDTTISSNSYFIKGDNIEISSKITDTDIDHIWLDLNQISGNLSHSNELCSSPSSGITCIYNADTVTYSFVSGTGITDGLKQIQFNSQNTSGGNDVGQIVSITADSTNPTIENDVLLTPTGLVGSVTTPVTWNTSKISDNIGLDYLEIEYSTGAGIWNLIGTGANTGTMNWDLTSVVSGNDYKIQITAFDLAGNITSYTFPIFEIDRTLPIVPTNTITFPNGGEMLGINGTETITWNSGSITDTNLAINPIELFYSTDGLTWTSIVSNLLNSGSYNWTHGNIDYETLKIKLQATDSVGNIANDESDISFIIDTTNPLLSINYATTPVDGSYINNSGFDILGNTSDIHFNTNGYIFQNLTTGQYFNGTIFTGATEIENNICTDPTSNGTNNSCDLITFNLLSPIINNNNYRLTLISKDEVGNQISTTPVDYIGDIVNPTISISTASGTYFQNSQIISGTSSDLGSGISSVKIQIKQGVNYWDGLNFVAGIQTLNTTTVDNFANWSYNFNYNGSDDPFEIIAIAYDKSYKVNNSTTDSITINKDTTSPAIVGGSSLFSSPGLGDIYIGGDNINITWNTGSITDIGAGLTATPIRIDYFNGTTWNLIAENEINDGNYSWSSDAIDSNNVIIRISATDNVGNTATQNSEIFAIDSTEPSISSVETMDMDTDGQIDALNIVMSENISDASIVLGDFNISNGIGNPTSYVTGGSSNDNQFILRFTNTGDTSLTPAISYTKGSLTDIAGKFLANTSNYLSDDYASPRLLSSEIFDINENGKFDKIISTFSENMNATTDISAFSINNVLNGITINSVSIIGDEAHVILSEGIDYNTSVGTMNLSFTSNINWEDLNNNTAGSVTNGIIDDKANPIAYIAEYYDLNTNSKVDSVDITFSENLIGFQNVDFNVSGLTKNTSSVLNNIVTINITETLGDNDTGVIADFSFTTGNLKDSYDNFVSSISNYNIEDKVIPKLLSIETGDLNGNGKIDNIILEFSENINSNFSTLVGQVDSYNITNYTKSGATELIMNVNEKTTFDSDETPLVNINSNTSLADTNGNLVNTFALTASIDKVGPVIIGARYDEALHKIFIQSSENINNPDFLTTSFVINNAGSYSIDSVNLGEKSISISGETVSYGSSEISFIANTMNDLFGNTQVGTYFTKLSPPIIINEVMVSDTIASNYIELRNLSNSAIDISGFSIAGVTIPALTTIMGNGYYLISKDTIVNSIINVVPDLVDGLLDISGASISLNDTNTNIDFANLATGFEDTSTPKSIERKDNSADGLLVASWYTAQKSEGFDNLTPFGTPGTVNVFDATPPIIGTYTPNDNSLYPFGTFDINFNYTDNIGGLGVDSTTDTITLEKWNGTTWGADIAGTYIDLPGKTITTTQATYNVTDLEFGKYRINFSISDNAGNIVNKIIIFYVDQITFDISTSTSSLGNLISGINTFSTNEVIITVETVGAGFTLDMSKTGNFAAISSDIIDWDSIKGFGFDLYNSGYSGNISSMGTNYQLVNEAQNININGNKNTYTYRIKYGANIEITQGAGNYSTDILFNLNTTY